MQSTERVVQLSLPRNHVGQILDGISVLTGQWDATAAFLRTGEVGSEIIRECSRPEEAERIAALYRTIAAEIREQLS